MWVPTPSEEAVKKFQKLVKDEFDLDLDMHEARKAATLLLRMHYLLAYVYPHLGKKDHAAILPDDESSSPK